MSEIKKLSGLAIASMVLGIIAIVLSWMPIINNVSFVTGIVGFAFAIPAMISTCKNKTKRGAGFAITGLSTNIVGIAITLYTQAAYASILASL